MNNNKLTVFCHIFILHLYDNIHAIFSMISFLYFPQKPIKFGVEICEKYYFDFKNPIDWLTYSEPLPCYNSSENIDIV